MLYFKIKDDNTVLMLNPTTSIKLDKADMVKVLRSMVLDTLNGEYSHELGITFYSFYKQLNITTTKDNCELVFIVQDGDLYEELRKLLVEALIAKSYAIDNIHKDIMYVIARANDDIRAIPVKGVSFGVMYEGYRYSISIDGYGYYTHSISFTREDKALTEVFNAPAIILEKKRLALWERKRVTKNIADYTLKVLDEFNDEQLQLYADIIKQLYTESVIDKKLVKLMHNVNSELQLEKVLRFRSMLLDTC